jgi:hypothetical protein
LNSATGTGQQLIAVVPPPGPEAEPFGWEGTIISQEAGMYVLLVLSFLYFLYFFIYCFLSLMLLYFFIYFFFLSLSFFVSSSWFI